MDGFDSLGSSSCLCQLKGRREIKAQAPSKNTLHSCRYIMDSLDKTSSMSRVAWDSNETRQSGCKYELRWWARKPWWLSRLTLCKPASSKLRNSSFGEVWSEKKLWTRTAKRNHKFEHLTSLIIPNWWIFEMEMDMGWGWLLHLNSGKWKRQKLHLEICTPCGPSQLAQGRSTPIVLGIHSSHLQEGILIYKVCPQVELRQLLKLGIRLSPPLMRGILIEWEHPTIGFTSLSLPTGN